LHREFMRSFFLTLLLLFVVNGQGNAQTQTFDPAVFLSTVKIHQYYGHGNVRIPDGMRAVLVDSVFSDRTTVAFSLRIEPDSGSGWTTWLDYDVDRYYRPCLTRVFAQRKILPDEEKAFARFRGWVENVQKKTLGTAREKGTHTVSWPWLTRTDYALEIRQVEQEGQSWLTLSLALDRGDGE